MPILISLLRSLAIGVPLCAAIALFLSVAFASPFGLTLVYSLCIGLTCQFLISGGLHVLARGLRLWRPDAMDERSTWLLGQMLWQSLPNLIA